MMTEIECPTGKSKFKAASKLEREVLAKILKPDPNAHYFLPPPGFKGGSLNCTDPLKWLEALASEVEVYDQLKMAA